MRRLYSLILLLSLTLAHGVASADHVLGGELLYEHITGNTYKISLTIYGECSGGTFYHLKNAHPEVNVINKEGALSTLILNEEIYKRIEISNVCPEDAAKTTCKSTQGIIPGVTRFVYSAKLQLQPSATWRFLFAGHMDNSGKSQTGFTNLISNIKNNTGFGYHLYLDATLNNLNGHNSSPQYTTNPTPFYCVNVPQQYNQGAADADNDNLRFHLVPPTDLNGINTEYIAPYSPTYPFSTQSGTCPYDTMTGQMAFTPSMTQVALVVNKVLEYRDGIIVGSSMRAMTFFMRGNCNNEAPTGSIEPGSVVGGLLYGNSVNLCDGQHKVAFKISASDNNSDDIQVAVNNLPNGANATISDNGTKKPVIDFSWDMTNVPPGTYTFFVRYNDGACPIPGNQVMAYSVTVAEPFTIFHEVLQPTNCINKQKVRFHLAGGLLPRKVQLLSASGEIIDNRTDNSGSIDDSFKAGTYKAVVYADNLPCSTVYTFQVRHEGTYPFPPEFEDIHHCLYDQVSILNPTPAGGGTVQWYDLQGNPLSAAPTYNTDNVGDYKWLINQKVLTCESVFDTFDVSIHDYPDVQIANKGGHACVGDGMYLEANGGVRYEWEPADKIVYFDNRPYAYIYGPEKFTVKGYSEYNCATSDTLVFDEIEQCCQFSYPNAFTPDGNGNNDGWHPVTYGNVDFYLLSIYNRWGQRIFTSSDPKEKWDGAFLGQPCDVGNYHYFLRARCITGHEENASGLFMLLR